ncbi:MAG: hypothetical protein P4M12_11715 [Gammaproteobacteria bacterium]|nr:hypothetical protein [Gammaproteobacteria bacterium]
MKISDIKKEIDDHYNFFDTKLIRIAGFPIGGWIARAFEFITNGYPNIRELEKFYLGLQHVEDDRELTNIELFSLVDVLFMRNDFYFDHLCSLLNNEKIAVLRFLNSVKQFNLENFDTVMQHTDTRALCCTVSVLMTEGNSIPQKLYMRIIRHAQSEAAALALRFLFKYAIKKVLQPQIDFILGEDPSSAQEILRYLSGYHLDNEKNLSLINQYALKAISKAFSYIRASDLTLTKDCFMQIVLDDDPCAAAENILAQNIINLSTEIPRTPANSPVSASQAGFFSTDNAPVEQAKLEQRLPEIAQLRA